MVRESFGEGFKNEFIGRTFVNGVSHTNLENILATLIHASCGAVAGIAIKANTKGPQWLGVKVEERAGKPIMRSDNSSSTVWRER